MAQKRAKPEPQSSQTNKTENSCLMEYSFDHEAIISNQKRLAFILHASIKDKTAKEFDRVTYKGVNYNLGDYVEIHSADKTMTYVAKLKRVVQVPKNLQEFPFIEVEWCLGKQKLPEQILAKYGEHISNFEIFPSQESTFCLYIDSIKCKCFVLTYEEYSQLQASYDYYYFSRAIFNESTNTLTPSPQYWKKICICNSPANPDRAYVQCEECENWFHTACAGNFDLKGRYVCALCDDSKI